MNNLVKMRLEVNIPMIKRQILIFAVVALLVPLTANAQPETCPNSQELEEVQDHEEFLRALQTVVPETYQKGELAEMYTDWRVITALPFPKTVGREQDEIYYEMAKNFCGKEVAEKSWLARLYFPKWEGTSVSALEGQIFVAKSQQQGWFVWFQYH